MHLVDAVTHYLLSTVFNVLGGATAINVFYGCRDNPIQYYGSTFAFNCSNPNEVIYVESAVIGFTPKYKADNGVFECPITADTCTNTTKEPSTFCDGRIECTFGQRLLQSTESGLKCNTNGTGSGGNWGGNFLNVNYSCISRDLCSPLAGYNKRYTCSMPTTSTPVASTYSFSVTEEDIATSEKYLNTTGTSGVESSVDALAATSSSAQETTAVGLIIGTTVGAVVLVSLLTILIIFIYKRRKRRKNNQQEPEVPLAHRNSGHDTKIDKLDGGNTAISRQRSIYELVQVVINYEVVRSSSRANNQISNAKKDLADITPQQDSQNSKFNIEDNSNGEVFYGMVRKTQNGSHIKSNDCAIAETDEAQSRVISIFPPVERNTGRRDYTNCAYVVTEKTIIERNVQENNEHSLSDIVEEVYCEPGNEVVLVDNALYCGR